MPLRQISLFWPQGQKIFFLFFSFFLTTTTTTTTTTLWHSNTIKYGLQRTQNAFQNGLKIGNPSTGSQDISQQSCVTF